MPPHISLNMNTFEFREPIKWFTDNDEWINGRFFDHIPANDKWFDNKEPMCIVKYNRNLEVILPYERIRKK